MILKYFPALFPLSSAISGLDLLQELYGRKSWASADANSGIPEVTESRAVPTTKLAAANGALSGLRISRLGETLILPLRSYPLRSVEFPRTARNVASGGATLLGAIAAPEFLKVRQARYQAHARNDCRKIF